jgi:allantoin racemase
MFRLGLLNPNTNDGHTTAMREVAAAALPDGCEVRAVTARRGPAAIESAADSAVAAAEVVELMRATPGLDAYLIGCFGDPGVDAARELTDAPVVGIGASACWAAAMVAKRFAIITTLSRGIPALEEALDTHGLRTRCVGVTPLGIPVAEQGRGFPATTAAIVAAAHRMVDDCGAEALVLACGGMADVASAVQAAVGVPVCDGVAFGAVTAHGLWRCGLRTSKTGAYSRPEPTPYRGMPAL